MANGTQAGGRELTRQLREHFGFRNFRPGQRRAVEAAMDGRDTVVVMPTGSGKSICFQLPALALEGTRVVVSPLIALMMDQTETLAQKGIAVRARWRAAAGADGRGWLPAMTGGKKEFVYSTPER